MRKAKRDRMILANLALAYSIARKMYYSNPTIQLIGSLEDAQQEAILALRKAIEKYDPKRGKLSTYATRVIRRRLQEESTSQALVRVPPYHVKYRSVSQENLTRGQRWTIRLSRLALRGARPLPAGFDRLAPEPVVNQADVLLKVESAFRYLEPRIQEWIKLHFGLNGKPPQTYREIGEKYGVSKQLIQNTVTKSLKRIRRIVEV
ncbi:MAG: sigma-70 family RNA polymerase sigma factor [Patescibacteria group bacterium]|nr:sigma-70 family RNA polymerase sigma factor [Patescibacteria group bacterium]